MNGKDLLCAIAEADAGFIRESARFAEIRATVRTERRKTRGRWTAVGIAAALCAAAVGIVRPATDVFPPTASAAETEIPQSAVLSQETVLSDVPVPVQSAAATDVLLSEWLNRPDVVWGTEEYKGGTVGADAVSPGTAKISDALERLMSGRPADTVYAVAVDFSSGIDEDEIDRWQYHEKTVAELRRELEELLRPTDSSQTYLITDADGNQTVGYLPPAENEAKIAAVVREIREIRTAFIRQKFDGYRESFRRQGLEIYAAGSEEDLSGRMVFYTFAVRAQLENFVCQPSEAFVFLPACELK